MQEKLIEFIRRLAKDDKEGVMAQKVLGLLWNLANSPECPTDILEQGLYALTKILEYSCSLDTETQQSLYIKKCVEEIQSNNMVLPPNKLAKYLCCLFSEASSNFVHHQVVSFRGEMLLDKNCQFVELYQFERMAAILTDYLEARNALLYVRSEDGCCKGWRVDFLVEELSSKVEEKLLLCSCCHGLLRDACLYEEELRCGVCIPEGATWQPVKINRNIVYEKMIYCPLKWRGCGWSDTLSTAVHHLEACLYIPVLCPLGCVSLEGEKKGEVVRMERRHIPEHLRDCCPLRGVMCEFCAGEVKACEMNPHLEVCEEFPLLCPNCCSREGEDGVREVKRKNLQVHLDNNCPLQTVQCPYWNHGCREEMERRLTDVHEREFMHIHFKLSLTEMKQSQAESTKHLQHELDIATGKIETLERQIADKDERIQSLSEVLFTYTQLPTGKLEWNVKEIEQRIRNKEETYSDPFYLGLYKCQCRIEWNYNNTGMVAVTINIMKGDFDGKLHWPIRYRFKSVLVNQINKDNLVNSNEITKKDLENHPASFKRPTEYRNVKGFGYPSFISNTEILEKKYCKQDSITLHVSLELLPHIIQH